MSFHAAFQWLKHQMVSSGVMHVHSPWLYELYQKLRHPQAIPQDSLQLLSQVHRGYSENQTPIEFEQAGSRTEYLKSTVSEVFIRTAKPLKQALRIAELASLINGKPIIELGTAFGTSTLALSMAAPKSRIISIEGVPVIARQAQEMLSRYGNPNIEVIHARFEDALPDILQSTFEPGLVFLDGHHLEGPTDQYVRQILPRLNHLSFLVIDDIHGSAGMTRCWNLLREEANVHVSIDLFHYGLLINNINLSRAKFSWRMPAR